MAADATAGYTNLGQGINTTEQNALNYIEDPDNNSAGVCARVVMTLDQTVAITRTEFNASLGLTDSSGGPLTNVQVNLKITDANGNDQTSLFDVSTPESTVFGGSGTVDGNGSLNSGKPARRHGPFFPAGKRRTMRRQIPTRQRSISSAER